MLVALSVGNCNFVHGRQNCHSISDDTNTTESRNRWAFFGEAKLWECLPIKWSLGIESRYSFLAVTFGFRVGRVTAIRF